MRSWLPQGGVVVPLNSSARFRGIDMAFRDGDCERGVNMLPGHARAELPFASIIAASLPPPRWRCWLMFTSHTTPPRAYRQIMPENCRASLSTAAARLPAVLPLSSFEVSSMLLRDIEDGKPLGDCLLRNERVEFRSSSFHGFLSAILIISDHTTNGSSEISGFSMWLSPRVVRCRAALFIRVTLLSFRPH